MGEPLRSNRKLPGRRRNGPAPGPVAKSSRNTPTRFRCADHSSHTWTPAGNPAPIAGFSTPGGGGKKVARHSTALGERRYRCYLPVLAEFTRLPMHGTWPTRTMLTGCGRARPYQPLPAAERTAPDGGRRTTNAPAKHLRLRHVFRARCSHAIGWCLAFA